MRCTIRNANANSQSDTFKERYNMHMKLVDVEGHPTLGIEPVPGTTITLRNEAGKLIDNSQSTDTFAPGTDGYFLELVGTESRTVSYRARIVGAQGGAVTLSQQLIEDSFQGSQYATVELVDEHPLTPGDGTGSGVPGRDWHYTRLPLANENGWNTSPVTVTFYPGDYDGMEWAPSEGAAKSLTGAGSAWERMPDTAGIDLSAQARNTSTGAVSVQKAGKVKIDTSAPRIEDGGALGYTLTDVPADASSATSGVWRLHRTDKAGSASVARASAGEWPREFPLDGAEGDRRGEATQAVGKLPNGYYRVEDAAGNLTPADAMLKVGDTDPPSVERPDPAGPNPPEQAGPELDPSDPVPAPTVTEDGEGLRHAVIEETVTEMIDPAAPPFGGL
ncbi:hypothetical protein VIN30_11050, partial [Adlercreutzia sp. R7]|nr:hypothetical protein [Adlercreutzia sp. R7]